MNRAEFLIEKTIKLYESKTGWGDSDEWTNQDFVVLSQRIQAHTGEPLSYVTLKRVWGKVKYDSLPNTHTLDTLVQFLGYENWRDFRSQNNNAMASVVTEKQFQGKAAVNTLVGHKPVAQKETWILKVLGVLRAWEG